LTYDKLLKVVFSLFIIITLFPEMGKAHSTLEKTFPAEGEVLTESPSTIDVWFQDPVILHSNSIELLNSSGEQIKVQRTFLDPDDESHIITELDKGIPSGSYSVNINVIALDGYVIKEQLRFQVEPRMEEMFKLIKYSPSDGTIVEETPGQIELWFNQPADITAIGLFNDQQQTERLLEPVQDPKDPSHIIVKIGQDLPPGTYQVTWYASPSTPESPQVMEIMDVFYFAVDRFTPIEQPNTKSRSFSFWVPELEIKQLGYFLVFTGLLSLFGGAFFFSVISKTVERKAWKAVSIVLLFLTMFGSAVNILSIRQELGSLSIEQFLSIKFVWIPLIQVLLLVVGLFVRKIRLFFYGLALIITVFYVGHAPYPRYGGYLTMMVNGLHFIGASVWVGGVLAIAVHPKKENRQEWLKESLPTFSKWAMISLVVIVISGIFMTFQFVQSFTVNSFLESEWGKLIIAKLIAVILVFGIGFFQWKRVTSLTNKGINAVISLAKVELLYVALILAFASLLVVATPSAAEQGVYPKFQEKRNTVLEVDIAPLYPGLNVITLNFNRDDIEKTEVTMAMPPNYRIAYDAFKVDDKTFKITGNVLHAAGTMSMDVKATTSNGEITEFTFKIVIPGEMRLNE